MVVAMRRTFFLLVFLGGSTSCSPTPGGPPPKSAGATAAKPEEWRDLALPGDIAKIDGLKTQWERALALARPTGQRPPDIKRLLDPNAGLERAVPTPGSYRCRYTRLGKRRPTDRQMVSSPDAFCYVGAEQGRLSLTTETGLMRLGGWLWEEAGERRLIFLGGRSDPKSKAPSAYGEDPARSVIGALERIDEFHFRLALPAAKNGEPIYLFELWPAI